jgi:uncharacterized protein (TIGR02996 family)
MTEREAFLRAIREDPEDDVVRLVFADWLDERGEHDAAEFIRLQCELEPVRHRLEDLRTRELIYREQRLENHRFGTAFEIDPAALRAHYEKLGYCRGLPDWMVISLDNLLKHGDQLFAAYPTLRELAIFGIEGRGADLAACPLLARIDVLEVADYLTPDDAVALAASSHIRSIRQFKLHGRWEHPVGIAHQLAKRSTPDWPERVEMIWLEDGLAAGMDAVTCDRPLGPGESYAELINVVAGRELAHDVRPALRLFPLRGRPFDASSEDELELGLDLGYGMYVGRLPDGAQALAACGLEEWYLVKFEANGLVTSVERRDCPIPGATWQMAAQIEEAERQWVTETLRLKPAVIRVREFDTGRNIGIRLWSHATPAYFSTHRPGRIQSQWWQQRGGWISADLRGQEFVIDWNNEFQADWRGSITAS